MRDSELRGVILEALYNQRRKDLVNLDQELGGLPVPHSATESILRQLVKKGLVERPIQSLNGLGNARITAYGIDVVQGKPAHLYPLFSTNALRFKTYKLVKVTSRTSVIRNWTSRTSVIRHWMFRLTIRKRATTSPNHLLNGSASGGNI